MHPSFIIYVGNNFNLSEMLRNVSIAGVRDFRIMYRLSLTAIPPSKSAFTSYTGITLNIADKRFPHALTPSTAGSRTISLDKLAGFLFTCISKSSPCSRMVGDRRNSVRCAV